MRTELFTVSRIFTEALYRIPDYQRGFSWGIDQLRDFWLDIEQLDGDAKHYTGVLTLEEVPPGRWAGWDDDCWIIQSRRYRPYYVVDGQQRLTTVVILLQVLLELGRPDHLNFTPRADVRRKYICDSKPEDAARSYIFGYERDNPSYEFLKKRILLEDSKVHLADEATIYTKNLLAAKEFFAVQVAPLQNHEIERLFTKLTQQLVFNVHEIATDIDVFVAFETMNNRGKPLSTLELLKNRLIFLSSKMPAPPGRELVLRRDINEAWKAAYHFLGKNDERPLDDDDFLRTFVWYFYLTKVEPYPDKDEEEQVRARRKLEVTMETFSRFLLNDLFTPKRIARPNGEGENLPELTREFLFEFAEQLKSAVELYFRLSTPSESNYSDNEKLWLERIGRLRGFPPSPMLLALFRKEPNSRKRAALLERIERLQFISLMGYRGPLFYQRRAYGPEYYLQYASGRMSTDDLITLHDNMVQEMLKESSLHDLLHEWMKGGGGFYGWRSLRYFLFEYELSLWERSKAKRQKVLWPEFSRENFKDDFETVEHIYPQRARDAYWSARFKQFSSAQKRALRNSLGNLVALAKPRNSSLSNRPFPEKLGDSESKTGYRYGSYSENEVATLSDWGPTEILERGLTLLDFLERRWNLKIGDRQQKIRALGLQFLES